MVDLRPAGLAAGLKGEVWPDLTLIVPLSALVRTQLTRPESRQCSLDA